MRREEYSLTKIREIIQIGKLSENRKISQASVLASRAPYNMKILTFSIFILQVITVFQHATLDMNLLKGFKHLRLLPGPLAHGRSQNFGSGVNTFGGRPRGQWCRQEIFGGLKAH